MSEKTIEVTLIDGKVEKFSAFNFEPAFEIVGTDDGDFVLVLDGPKIDAGYRIEDVKSFSVYNN